MPQEHQQDRPDAEVQEAQNIVDYGPDVRKQVSQELHFLVIGELLDRCAHGIVGGGNEWSVAGYLLLSGVRACDETVVAMCLRARREISTRLYGRLGGIVDVWISRRCERNTSPFCHC